MFITARNYARAAALFASILFASVAGATTLTGTPAATATVGQRYSFTPVMTNPSSCGSCFRVRSLPTWASFSATTGTLQGTPPAPGVFANIRIYARLKTGTYALPAFSISVDAAAPAVSMVISGTPAAAATVAQFYNFTPTVKAAAGATLSFSVSNKPAWATFNGSNGSLSGTPAATDVAKYSNILISVSDGSSGAVLPAFDITVGAAAPVSGIATLSWTIPTQNTDGSALTDLAGYRIYYGTSASALDKQIAINSPAANAASIENLTSGTWYFAISDYNSAGVESGLSTPVSAMVL